MANPCHYRSHRSPYCYSLFGFRCRSRVHIRYSSILMQNLRRLGYPTLYVLMIHVVEDDILGWVQIVKAVGARGHGLAWFGVLAG